MSDEALRRPDDGELLVIVGPTASGKSALAMTLAERFDGDIIGADSVQIYRHFDIGSGKPTREDRKRVPHHLVDEVDPLEKIDAATWAARADDIIRDIRARGRVPIVCGGAFLWVKALVWGLAPMPAADEAIRARHRSVADERGRAALHSMLADVDGAAAERLAPNDLLRVSRALEVFELTGKTQTAWHEEHQFRQQRHRARFIGIERSRETIDERIATRCDSWIEDGWIEEVQSLIERGYRNARAMESVGYRQVRDMLDGELAREELQVAIVRATRVFVRRQRTWLRDQTMHWIPA